MLTLGIETSCDETSCAVLKGKNRILSNVISSSYFRHRPFGGVVPEIASRHSLEQIATVYREALREAKVKAEDLDLVAVTQGPGLIGSLFVGICFGKSLSYELGIPFVGVNHLEAHLVANFIGRRSPDKFIGLLVSGGHTSLSYHNSGEVTRLGATVDDAVGEAFDKVAKILGLEYPGGPIIEKLAKEGNESAIRFTKPKQKNRFDFSFSGIKTAVLYHVQNRCGIRYNGRPGRNVEGNMPMNGKKASRSFQRDVAASFQGAVVSWLVTKTLDAVCYKKVSHIVVGGGVSANQYLKDKLTREAKKDRINVWFPPRDLALDNAAMIARRGTELYENGIRGSLDLTGVPNLKVA